MYAIQAKQKGVQRIRYIGYELDGNDDFQVFLFDEKFTFSTIDEAEHYLSLALRIGLLGHLSFKIVEV